jgi:hypothetical protein
MATEYLFNFPQEFKLTMVRDHTHISLGPGPTWVSEAVKNHPYFAQTNFKHTETREAKADAPPAPVPEPAPAPVPEPAPASVPEPTEADASDGKPRRTK